MGRMDLTEIWGIGPAKARLLREAGLLSVADVAEATVEQISSLPGTGVDQALKIRASAVSLVQDLPTEEAIEILPEAPPGSPDEKKVKSTKKKTAKGKPSKKKKAKGKKHKDKPGKKKDKKSGVASDTDKKQKKKKKAKQKKKK